MNASHRDQSAGLLMAGLLHFVSSDDINVVLSGLPEELWMRLRAVHFNDRGCAIRDAAHGLPAELPARCRSMECTQSTLVWEFGMIVQTWRTSI